MTHKVGLTALGLVLVAAPAVASAALIKGKVDLLGRPPSQSVVYLERVPEGAFTLHPTRERISQKGARFSPSLLPVQVGSEVDMTNDDWIQHSVYSMSLTKIFDLGLYEQGVERIVTFDTPGVVEIGCWIHPKMSAVVLVLQNPFFTTPRSDGAFELHGVPAGRYVLKAYRRGGPSLAAQVEVTATGTVTAAFEKDH